MDTDLVYQSMLTIFMVLVSLLLVISFTRYKKDIVLLIVLYLWHTFFSVAYYRYTLSNSADARRYYRLSLGEEFTFYPGTKFIAYTSSFISQGLSASYLNTTLFYNLIGSLGLVFLYLALRPYLRKMPWYWTLILFIPSMSFWSGGLGKDAISFFAICCLLYSITLKRKLAIFIPLSFFAMFMVRPHVAFLMLVSYIIYFIMRAEIHILFKISTLPIILFGVFLSKSFVQDYVGLDDASLNTVSDYIDSRQASNLGGGSSLDITSMSYPMQIFTYIFRPLPFEAHSVVALITSIENIIILCLFLYLIAKSKFNLKVFIKNENLWLFIYALLTCSILAMTTANLGIATRQKWMFMPVLIYLLIYAFHDYKTKKNKVYS